MTAIQECKRNAEAMMGPRGSEIIAHHYEEKMKLVDKLPDYGRLFGSGFLINLECAECDQK